MLLNSLINDKKRGVGKRMGFWRTNFWPCVIGIALLAGFLFPYFSVHAKASTEQTKEESTPSKAVPKTSTSEKKEPSPKKVSLGQVVKQLSEAPHFQELYKMMEGKYPSKVEAFHLALELGIRGRARLDDGMLAVWAGVKAKILDQFEEADVATCAAVARENPDASQLLKSVAHIDPKDLDAYWAIYLKAAEAELKGNKIVLLDHKEMGHAWNEFLHPLPKETSSRLKALIKKEEKSDEETCWVGKTLFGIVTTMNVSQKEVLIRTLAIAPEGKVLQWR